MNILLTGATGFLGYRTLEKLVEMPGVSRIVATGRKLAPYRHIVHDRVVYRLGNLEDASFVNSLTRDVDVIINTASLSAPWGHRQDFIRANLQTQSNLVAAAKANRVSRFIYISSPSIYYNGRDRIGVKESDPLPDRFVNEYARTKFEAEQLLANGFGPFIVLRPRALIGRGDSIIMPRLIKAFDERRLRVIGNGQNMVDLTAVSNVADAITCAINAGDEALNEAYNITNGEPVNLWEHITKVLGALGRQIGKNKVSFALADGFARMLEIKARLTGHKEPALTRYGVGTLAKSFTLDISKAHALLGYRPQLNTEAAIQEFVSWYRNDEVV